MSEANKRLYVSLLIPSILASMASVQIGQQSFAQIKTDVEHREEYLLTMNDKQSELLRRINDARQAEGLAPLSFSNTLSRAAQVHVRDIVEHNYSLTHIGSDGSSVRDRAEREGYPSRYVGENVAAGNDSVEDTFDQWMNSTGHRDNILSLNYTQIGIGYYLNAPNTTYDHYWVTVFGSPER